MHEATAHQWIHVRIALTLDSHFSFRMPFCCVCLLVEAIVLAETAEQYKCHTSASVTRVWTYASRHFLCAYGSVLRHIEKRINTRAVKTRKVIKLLQRS